MLRNVLFIDPERDPQISSYFDGQYLLHSTTTSGTAFTETFDTFESGAGDSMVVCLIGNAGDAIGISGLLIEFIVFSEPSSTGFRSGVGAIIWLDTVSGTRWSLLVLTSAVCAMFSCLADNKFESAIGSGLLCCLISWSILVSTTAVAFAISLATGFGWIVGAGVGGAAIWEEGAGAEGTAVWEIVPLLIAAHSLSATLVHAAKKNVIVRNTLFY